MDPMPPEVDVPDGEFEVPQDFDWYPEEDYGDYSDELSG